MPIVFPTTLWSSPSGGTPSAPTPTVYWEADHGVVTTTDGTTADASPVSGNKVLSWTSKDASATVASIGTNSQRPTYVVPTYGKPYLTFDGSQNHRLQTTAWNSTFNNAAAYTMGVYFRRPPVYSGYRNESFMSLNNTGNSGTLQAGPSGAGVSLFSGGVTYMGGTRVILSYASEMVGTTSFFGSFSTTSTSTAASSITKLYYDGVLVASDTTSNATVNYTNVITLGGTFDTSTSKTKDCYGFYLYNSQLSDADVLAVHNAAASRMNVSSDYAKTMLLLHFDGANGSTTFTDSSPNALTATVNGSVAITTLQSVFGGSSANFPGASYLSFASNPVFAISAAQDFTIECWVRFNSVANCGFFQGLTNLTSASGQMWFGYYGGNLTLGKHGSGTYNVNYSWTPSANTWYHVAACRSGGTTRLFIDGAVVATSTANSGQAYTQSGACVGVTASPVYFNGQMDEFRLAMFARYTSAFTPTGPFPNS